MTVPVDLLRHPHLTLVLAGGEGRLLASGNAESELARAFYQQQGLDMAKVHLICTCSAHCRTICARSLMRSSALTARLEARIGTDLSSLLKRAVEQAEITSLSMADQRCFADALLSPQKPEPALKRAMTRRRSRAKARPRSRDCWLH